MRIVMNYAIIKKRTASILRDSNNGILKVKTLDRAAHIWLSKILEFSTIQDNNILTIQFELG